jgi:hypothetical protein
MGGRIPVGARWLPGGGNTIATPLIVTLIDVILGAAVTRVNPLVCRFALFFGDFQRRCAHIKRGSRRESRIAEGSHSRV